MMINATNIHCKQKTMFKLKNNDLIKSASYASVSVALMILTVKFYGWFETNSQSMLASLVDSFLDISSSLINLIAIRVSMKPADDDHRFGHDKFQDLAIFSQSMFFFASGLFTLISSASALHASSTPENPTLGVNAMYFCIALTLLLVLYQSYVIKRTKSKIIMADKLHYFADFLTNIAVVVSLYLAASFWYIDALAGIAISLYIIRASYTLFISALHNLSDREFEQDEKEKILQIVRSFPEAKGVHELKTRCAGDKPFIQFHLELDGALSLIDAHEISERVANELMKKFPNSEIIIHQDPVGLEKEVNYVEQI